MARTTKPLTNTEIDRAKAKEKDLKLTDGHGLFLLVKTNGSRLWRFNYYKPLTTPPKRTEISLGKYPDISLAQARKQREVFLALLAENIDLQIHRQQIESEEISKRENTLYKVADKWRQKRLNDVANGEIQAKTIEKNWTRLEKHLFPILGNHPISSIPPTVSLSRQVIRLLEKMQKITGHRILPK